MGKDDFDAWGDGADNGGGGHEEVDGGATGFVAVVDHWLVKSEVDLILECVGRQYHRKVRVYAMGVHGVRWVDKYNRLMLLQLLPERTEIGMPKVMVVVTISSIERDTVGLQGLQ